MNSLSFSELTVGRYVRWNSELNCTPAICGVQFITEYGEIIFWSHEPSECIMEVVHSDRSWGEGRVELSCSSDCGGHTILSFSEEEYDNLGLHLVSGPALEDVGMQAVSDLLKAEVDAMIAATKQGYDFESDSRAIRRLIDSRNLPKPRKKMKSA